VAILETRTYYPYGQPLSSTGMPQAPLGYLSPAQFEQLAAT
jgi:hypothetical protein